MDSSESLKDSEGDSIRQKLRAFNTCKSKGSTDDENDDLPGKDRFAGKTYNSVRVLSSGSVVDDLNRHSDQPDQEDWKPTADPLRKLVFYSALIFFMASFLIGVVLSLLYYDMSLKCERFPAFTALEVGSLVLCILFGVCVGIFYAVITGKEKQAKFKMGIGLIFFVFYFGLWIFFSTTICDKTTAIAEIILTLQLINQIILALIVWFVGLDPLCIFTKAPQLTESQVILFLSIAKESLTNPKRRLKRQYIMLIVLLALVIVFDGITFAINCALEKFDMLLLAILNSITFILDLISLGYTIYCARKHFKNGYYIGYREIFILQFVQLTERVIHVTIVTDSIFYAGNGHELMLSVCPEKTKVETAPYCSSIVLGILCLACCFLWFFDGVRNFLKHRKEREAFIEHFSTSRIVKESSES